MSELIRLICTSCGASLGQSTDGFHYKCAYCGTEHTIKGAKREKKKVPIQPDLNLCGPTATDDDEIDDLFEEAARITVRSQQGSVSLLQRKLSIGYTRAARIVDQLEEAGVVGAFVGSKAREVLVADELALDAFFKARVLG